jgi:hypothetical protein
MNGKKSKVELGSFCALALVAAAASVQAQQTESVTGSVRSISPDASSVVVQLANGSPISCSYSKDAAFVDAAGNAMAGVAVKPEDVITVSGTMEGGHLIVSKVVFTKVYPIVENRRHPPISW